MNARRPTWADPERLLPWMCVAAIVGRLAAVAIAFPGGDGDRLWQRWLGERIIHEHVIPRALGLETFAAPGAPWTPQEWLFSLALALGTDHGVPWLVPLISALIVGLGLVMVVLRCQRRGLSGPLTSAAVMLVALATVQSFGVRAQVFGWAGIATVLWLLESEGPMVWGVVPVTIVWANLHASVFLAPAVATLFLLSALLRERNWSRGVRRYAGIVIACTVATLATPLGVDLPRYAIGLLTSPIRHSISEWGATSMDSLAFVLGAFPLVLALCAFGVRGSLPDRIVAFVFTVLLFTAVRNVPVFAFAIAPIGLAALPLRRQRSNSASRAELFAAWTTVAAATLLAIVIPILSWRAAPRQETVLPIRLAHALLSSKERTPPRVFCEDFAWCSIFLAESRPAQFFMDGRADPYPVAVWREYRTVIDGNTGWDRILSEHRIDAVLVRRNSALDSLLAERPHEWHLLAKESRSRLYTRTSLMAEKNRP